MKLCVAVPNCLFESLGKANMLTRRAHATQASVAAQLALGMWAEAGVSATDDKLLTNC